MLSYKNLFDFSITANCELLKGVNGLHLSLNLQGLTINEY